MAEGHQVEKTAEQEETKQAGFLRNGGGDLQKGHSQQASESVPRSDKLLPLLVLLSNHLGSADGGEEERGVGAGPFSPRDETGRSPRETPWVVMPTTSPTKGLDRAGFIFLARKNRVSSSDVSAMHVKDEKTDGSAPGRKRARAAAPHQCNRSDQTRIMERTRRKLRG